MIDSVFLGIDESVTYLTDHADDIEKVVIAETGAARFTHPCHHEPVILDERAPMLVMFLEGKAQRVGRNVADAILKNGILNRLRITVERY